jgi:hypothetical protein
VNRRPDVARTAVACALLLSLGVLSFLVFRGYLTPDMMVYFLTFQWCF